MNDLKRSSIVSETMNMSIPSKFLEKKLTLHAEIVMSTVYKTDLALLVSKKRSFHTHRRDKTPAKQTTRRSNKRYEEL